MSLVQSQNVKMINQMRQSIMSQVKLLYLVRCISDCRVFHFEGNCILNLFQIVCLHVLVPMYVLYRMNESLFVCENNCLFNFARLTRTFIAPEIYFDAKAKQNNISFCFLFSTRRKCKRKKNSVWLCAVVAGRGE